MRKIGYVLVFILPVLFLLASPVALACSNACSATTQYACSLVTSSMTKSSSGTLTVSLTNKQASSVTETASITGSWFSASTGSVSSTFNQNVPASVSFTVTPNDAGSKAVCVNMETTGCQADCGSITIDSPASLGISSLSSSASTVAASASFTVTGTVQNSGTIAAGTTSSVAATLSGNTCTVTSGAQTIGQLAGSSSWSNSWTVTMGTSNCVLTLSASGTPGGSASSSITVTKQAASTTTTSSSSGESTGVASDALPNASNIGAVETIILTNMPAGENKLKISKSEISWTQVSINLREAISGQSEFKIQSLKDKPVVAETGEKIYQYLYIDTKNIPATKILGASIRFKVPNSWLTKSDAKDTDVVLKRYSAGAWTDLSTKKISCDSINTIFEAQTPAFSYFAVGLKEGTAAAKEADKQQEITALEEKKQQLLEELQKKEETIKEIEKKSLTLYIFAISLAAILLAVSILFYMHKRNNEGKGRR